MKAIRIIPAFFLALGLLVQAGSLKAQDPAPPKGEGARMEKLKTELQLTDAQAQQLEGIHAKYRPEREALRKRREAGEEVHAEMKQLREAEKAEVDQVLSPEQRERFEALRKEHRHHGEHGFHHDPEARRYFHENILPVLHAQRLKLEAQLSSQDKDAIASLRTRLEQLKAEQQASRQEDERPTPPDPATREERHAILEDAAALAEKYRGQILALHEEIKPQLERWKAEMEKLHPKPEGDLRGKPLEEPKDAWKPMKAGRFLLMDPAANPKAKRQGEALAPNSMQMKVFPSPASSRASLQYWLPQAGAVTVELLSQDGKVLQTLHNAQESAGEHFIDLDTEALGAGTYFFRVTDASGSRVRKLVVVK